MKKRIGHLIAGGFYTYVLYEFKDAKGKKFYIAEPKGMIGATRGGDSIEEIQRQLDKDVPMLRLISKEMQKVK